MWAGPITPRGARTPSIVSAYRVPWPWRSPACPSPPGPSMWVNKRACRTPGPAYPSSQALHRARRPHWGTAHTWNCAWRACHRRFGRSRRHGAVGQMNTSWKVRPNRRCVRIPEASGRCTSPRLAAQISRARPSCRRNNARATDIGDNTPRRMMRDAGVQSPWQL